MSFSDKKFSLEYLTFNLSNQIERILKIAKIFYRWQFNSKIYDLETETEIITLSFKDKSFHHNLTFRFENKS